MSTQFTSQSHIFRLLQNFQTNSFFLFLSYQGSNQNSKWYSNGVVCTLSCYKIIDFTGTSEKFQDIAVATKKYLYHILNPPYNYFIQFIITLIIISFSSGFDSAIIIVSATSVWSSISFSPFLNKASFLSKKYRNIVAAIRLFPSKKL